MNAAISNIQARLRLSDARQDAILKAALDAIVIMDAEGRFIEFNPAAERLFGYSRDDVLGKAIADFIIPERLRQAHVQGMARYLATGRGAVVNTRVELLALKASGEEFPVEIAIVPIAGAEPPVFVGFIRDITEYKRSERRRQWLLDELAHRSRNLFAVLQAIVSRTLRDDRPASEARTTLNQRLNALARSHVALIANPEGGADLGQIVAQEVEGFSSRVTTLGPPVAVNGKAAQTFALIVHELATNAAKHGALSTPGGSVTIIWSLSEDRLRFEWREHNGPAISAPIRVGFGAVVLKQLAASELSATVDICFQSDGLIYQIDASVYALMSA